MKLNPHPGVVAAETPLLSVGGADTAGAGAAPGRMEHPGAVLPEALALRRPEGAVAGRLRVPALVRRACGGSVIGCGSGLEIRIGISS